MTAEEESGGDDTLPQAAQRDLLIVDDDQRFCDEDSDIGLSYTMAKLAPEVVK